MKFDFETEVSRDGLGNMKQLMTPDFIREAGISSFNAAEMDYPTCPGIRERVADLARNGLFGYTVRTAEYDDAVCWWMKNVRGWDASSDTLITAQGTIFSVAAAVRMLTEPGEAIIVQPPVYYRYEQAAMRLGRRTVYNRLIERNGYYEMDFADLEEKMAEPENKLLVLCNPQNPVGRVWSEAELREIGRLSARYQVPVFCDEIFSEITFEGHRAVPYASLPEGQEWAITCTSPGKAFNLTGLNHANVFIPNPALREAFERQRTADHYGSMEPLAYAAILGAYNPDGAAWVQAVRDYIGENVHILQQAAAEPGFPAYLYPVEGTYVGWLRWDGLPLEGEALSGFLEREALFHMGPGSEYDPAGAGYTRISLGCQQHQLTAALKRLKQAVRRRQA